MEEVVISPFYCENIQAHRDIWTKKGCPTCGVLKTKKRKITTQTATVKVKVFGHTNPKIAAAYQKVNGLCHYCGRKTILNAPYHHPDQATLDHIVPKCNGGKEKVLCCRRCNQDKGPLPLHTWIKYGRWFEVLDT